MAKFYAFVASDIVGSDTELYPLPVFGSPYGTNNAAIVLYTTSYIIINNFSSSTNLQSIIDFEMLPSFVPGEGEVRSLWQANAGDIYSNLAYAALLNTPGPNAGFTSTPTADVFQFLFAFDDSVHGSDAGDKLCGWAGKDNIWGGESLDEFYYGKGMGKDSIMDYVKGENVVLDDGVSNNFKKLKKEYKIKYKDNKDLTKIKLGDGDLLKIHGVDTQKELKHALVFDDFTDFA